MIDMTLIRERPDWVKTQLANLQDEPAIARIDKILELDQRRRALLVEKETKQAWRNKLNAAYGRLRGNKTLAPAVLAHLASGAAQAITAGNYEDGRRLLSNPAGAAPGDGEADSAKALGQLSDALRHIAEQVEALDKETEQIDADLRENMLWIPNMPHTSVKIGVSDAENIAYPPEGLMPEFDFTPKAHWDLGPELDLIDFEAGVKMAGTRFYVLKGMGARLQRALISFYLDMHIRQHGFTEVYTPFLVKAEMLYGAAQFPKFRDV